LNRVTSIHYPTGNAVSISYGAASKAATRGSLTESTFYDGFGRPVSVTLGGISRSFSVDALGRKTFESDPGTSAGTSYQYDILNRVTRIGNADGTARAISYGAGSKTVVDERSKSTTFIYRAYSNPDQQFLMSVSAPESSANVFIARNSKDLITSATQAGFTRSYGYNSNYYLTSVTNPETGTSSYGRDAAGNMTSRSVGSSGATGYSYDGQNRLTSVTYPGSTPSVTNTYNKTHKLLTANSSTGNRSFSYDANGNLTSESLVIDSLTFTTSYAYNGNDQLSAITYPRSGATVNYSPDVLGRPTQVSGFVSSVSYWPSGQIRQINYANGTVTSYNQNSRLWPSTFSTQKSGGPLYSSSSYSYDGAGNLTAISDPVDSTYNRTLGYDNINRLIGISGPWGSGTIAYNGAGNITSQVLGSSGLFYSYDGSNRLSSVSGSRATSYGYDAYGNIVNGSGNAYTYDGAPNLRCVNCANATNKIEYSYDGTNQRSSVAKAGVKTYEMYGSSGNQLIEFTPSQSNKLVEYIYLGGKRVAQRVTP
jgi:YD repeat-containing protein